MYIALDLAMSFQYFFSEWTAPLWRALRTLPARAVTRLQPATSRVRIFVYSPQTRGYIPVSVPDMSAEQEFFLYELETTDSGSIGLVLRCVSPPHRGKDMRYDTKHFQSYI